jgi:glycosyltransferase involved in cell wall biosynthesis
VHLSVVIPAFNEATRIGSSISTLRDYLGHHPFEWELRVVDDGSSDGTGEAVLSAAAGDLRVVLQREPHRGKGAAVRAGLLAARGNLRFMCDADLSMPVGQLTRFLAIVPRDCDVAIGSREGAGARRLGEPVLRHVMGRVFNRLVQVSVLPGIDDTQCGFKLLTARAAQVICSSMTIEGWAFDIEMLQIARVQGWRVREVPIEWHYRDRSRVSAMRDTWRMARDLWRVRANARRGAYSSASSRVRCPS